MGDLVHMFAVIEGSRGDNDEPAACSMNQKVSAGEAIWRPDGGVEACGKCHPQNADILWRSWGCHITY